MSKGDSVTEQQPQQPGHQEQPDYQAPPPGYQQPPPGYQMPPPGYVAQPPMTPEQAEGRKAADNALVLGILSLFFVGFVLGPIAISKANRAAKFGVDATAGQVTGWIGAIIGVLQVLVGIFIILTFLGVFSFIAAIESSVPAT